MTQPDDFDAALTAAIAMEAAATRLSDDMRALTAAAQRMSDRHRQTQIILAAASVGMIVGFALGSAL